MSLGKRLRFRRHREAVIDGTPSLSSAVSWELGAERERERQIFWLEKINK